MLGDHVRFIFEGDGRSTIRTLHQIADQSQKTNRTMQRGARESATVYERLGHSTIALREGVSGLAGMVGLGGLAFGLKDAVEGGMALQASQAQLQQALRATGQASGDTYGKLKDYAEALSTHGGFADPENVQALTAFTRETRSASRAQSLLALSTNIARGRGLDLAYAQSVVSRAYTGQIGRLQQLLGPMIAVRNAQFGLSQAHREEIAALETQSRSMGRLGSQWLRQQEIARNITPQMVALAQLQDKSATAQQILGAAQTVFGNATGAYAKTTQGKISDLQNSLRNLAEETGEHLLPAVNLLAKDLTWVVGAFSKLPVPVQAGVVGLTALGVLLGPLKEGFGLLKSGAEGAGRMLGILETQTDKTAGSEALLQGASEKAALGEDAAGAGGVAALGGEAAGAGGLALAARAGFSGLLAAGGGALAGSMFRNMTHIGTKRHAGTGSLIGSVLGGGAGFFLGGPLGAALGGGLGNVAGGLIGSLFSTGGVVRPRYLASGGGIGTDTVLGWLTPGEGVVSTRGMALLGEGGLAMLNAGMMPGGRLVIQPGVTVVKIDSRAIAEAVTRYTLSRAARGPQTLVGGSLMTGAPGLPG